MTKNAKESQVPEQVPQLEVAFVLPEAKSEDKMAPVSEKEPATQSPIVNAFWILINIVSSVSLVLVNKWIFQVEGFSFGAVMTLIHFFVTALGLELCALFSVFEKKPIPFRSVLMLSASFTGFVVLTNLSLKYNSVGFYQLTKVLTTPCIIAIQMMFYSMSFPIPIHVSVAVILVGVTIVSVTDIYLNWVGSIIAFSGVLVTSLYQIWANTQQTALGVNSMQLLYHQSRMSCVLLLLTFPAIENLELLNEAVQQMTLHRFSWIMTSAILAFFVNLSTFFVIGNTSPVTYNVVGHFKTCVVLFGGFIIFNYPIESRNLVGIFITLAGVFIYTYFKLKK
eukprot:TRINITY_DN3629_c0_g1_i1.p1 TRINITY_DN3629_c0_g1~~TRINITY_DN3629_c0_g1_i1.p1  ORF type:complete len:337 (+),score=120.13 TRINITY_DN3629_c0_g1_i1:74-1084(+)